VVISTKTGARRAAADCSRDSNGKV
jgi:hypothetical protein